MANPYYNYDSAFIAGTLGRAEQVAAELAAVTVGFGLLTVQGVDSGAANAYVVNVTSGGPSGGAYVDGQIIEFKAANANTGGSTINVNSIGVVSLTSFNGQTLVGGAIAAGTWYRILYNSTYSAWTLIAPTSQVITSNTISASAPTHLVGLTAAGGISTACAPIDVTFALDQSIAPTWTGAHIFSSAVTFNNAPTFSAGLGIITGVAASYVAVLDGSSISGQSFGLEINAGTNASDNALLVNSQGGTAYLQVKGEGSVVVGTPTGGAKGPGTINAANLYVNGVAVQTAAVAGANPTASVGLTAVNGSASTFLRSDGAPALSQAIAPTWTGAHVWTPSSAVTAITVNGAANTTALSIVGGTNTANVFLATIATGQGSGFSSGLSIAAGTTSNDKAFFVENAAGNTGYFTVWGDGEITINPPTAATAQGSTGPYQAGYMDIPRSTNTSLVFADRAKFIDASGNITIPANASVAYPIGTTLLLFNDAAGSITISVTSDQLFWLPTGATGTRTLAVTSLATIYKRTATQWLIWGFGLT